MYTNMSAILLAGGKSTRMGFDKQKIRMGEGYLIELLIKKLKAYFFEIIVVTQTPELYHTQDVITTGDILPSGGPLAGLHAGLTISSNPYCFVMACDMPNINLDYITYLIEKLREDTELEGVVTRYKGWIEPFNAFYTKALIPEIAPFIAEGGRSMYQFLRHRKVHYIEESEARFFSKDWSMFENINEPRQLGAFRQKESKVVQMTYTKDLRLQSQTVTCISESGMQVFEDVVIREFALTVYINDKEFLTLLCTPDAIELLVLGFLFNEGMIRGAQDLLELSVNLEKGTAHARLRNIPKLISEQAGKRMITSGCGKGSVFYHMVDDLRSHKIVGRYRVYFEQILHISRSLNQICPLFKATGGAHSCSLWREESLIAVYEDIGRHNALDKLIGFGLESQLDFSNTILLTSGRISSEMLIKAAKSGIPVVVSHSAPTDLAVTLADQLGITLIGFARGMKFNIYTHRHRIEYQTNQYQTNSY